MKLNETTLSFLQEDCIMEFGKENGSDLYLNTEKTYQELLANADDKGNPVIHEHLAKKLFPPMAYYKALLAAGYEQETALTYVKKETHKAALVRKQEMQGLAKLPFAYTIYRMGVKKHMKKNFPEEGWTTEWVRCDGTEIHFNLRRCIYQELTEQYNCQSSAAYTAKMMIFHFPVCFRKSVLNGLELLEMEQTVAISIL